MKKLKDITELEIIDLLKIEGVHCYFEFWSEIKITRIDRDMFNDTIVIEFFQINIKDKNKMSFISYFLNFKKFDYHYTQNDSNYHKSSRFSIESIRYLINNGFDINESDS